MKLFRDNTTGEMLISITDKKAYLLHFDGTPYIKALDNVSEVNTDGSLSKFHRQHVVEEDLDINDNVKWHLKDVLCVPTKGGTAEFRVEHISNNKVYFVAVDGIGKSTMANMNNFLDKFLNDCPKSLVSKMCEIEHKLGKKIIRKSKIALLSYANVVSRTEDCKCNGADDIQFDGLRTGAERCKNFANETFWYWLDTPDVFCSTMFFHVNHYGFPSCHYTESNAFAVVPCFAIEREE